VHARGQSDFLHLVFCLTLCDRAESRIMSIIKALSVDQRPYRPIRGAARFLNSPLWSRVLRCTALPHIAYGGALTAALLLSRYYRSPPTSCHLERSGSRHLGCLEPSGRGLGFVVIIVVSIRQLITLQITDLHPMRVQEIIAER